MLSHIMTWLYVRVLFKLSIFIARFLKEGIWGWVSLLGGCLFSNGIGFKCLAYGCVKRSLDEKDDDFLINNDSDALIMSR